MQFSELLPDVIFDAVTPEGHLPTGALTPLNSYENRVYSISIEEADPIIAKFYRPGRWTGEAIAEEHAFIEALVEAEIPVVAPLTLQKSVPYCKTLGQIDSIYYAFFPKFRGREHDEITTEDRLWLGRTLGRLHNIGEAFKAPNRMRLTPQTYGFDSTEFILNRSFLPEDLRQNLSLHLFKALELITPFFKPDLKAIPLHGDCHPGNILWNRDGPTLVDFDDMVIAPPVQDLWMLFNGTPQEMSEQREVFLEGYETFRKFDRGTFILTEPLRTLRIIRYAAWIGQRYEEPAFKRAFPYYEERRYWEEFLLSLKEQISLLQEAS